MLSPRVAPPMIGLGLLEAVNETDIMARSDPDDRDGDGISGKPNQVWSDRRQAVMLGRFGRKAGRSTIEDQVQDAFTTDIGISVPLHPAGWGECTAHQAECRRVPDGNSLQYGNVEADQTIMDLTVFYVRHLAVPARRGAESTEILAGKRLFYMSGCAACHTPTYSTSVMSGEPELSGQKIWPYTDLLLHDLGEGLSDQRPEGLADGREWRTAPLWGIGLTSRVNGHSFYLHDGRARNLLEAVLWHGGEAEAARDAVVRMTAGERANLFHFVESL
jgi:CxxC motif-containing protein (DUF1111 family)